MKVDNEKDDIKTGGGLKVALTMIGTAVAVLGVTLAALTYKLSLEESERKQKDEEAATFQKSVDCSYSHCGADECAREYTNRYPGGEGTTAVIEATEKAKNALQCRPKTTEENRNENKPVPPRTVFQNGYGNQANTGNGNNSIHMEFGR